MTITIDILAAGGLGDAGVLLDKFFKHINNSSNRSAHGFTLLDPKDNATIDIIGSHFTYGSGAPTGGTVSKIVFHQAGSGLFDLKLSQPLDILALKHAADTLQSTGDSSEIDQLFGTQPIVFNGGEGPDHFRGPDSGNRIFGHGGNDQLRGGLGADLLNGGDGDDKLEGGLGRDKFVGGTGADTFVFKTVGDSGVSPATRDLIQDFSHADGDKVSLKGIDANENSGGNQAFHFIKGAAFHNIAGELHALKQNLPGTAHDVTIVEGDTNGDGVADFQIELKGLINLVKGDFVL